MPRKPALNQGLRGQRPKRAQDLHQKSNEGAQVPVSGASRGVCPGMGAEASVMDQAIGGAVGSRGADIRLSCETLPTMGEGPQQMPQSPATPWQALPLPGHPSQTLGEGPFPIYF